MNHLAIVAVVLAAAVPMMACGDADDGSGMARVSPGADETPGADSPAPQPGPTCPATTVTGFDGQDLFASRATTAAGMDRGRVKPFTALVTEYKRVLGVTPASLAGAAATFGAAEPRWSEEPASGAVALQTAFAVAFDGCLEYTKAPSEFAAAPDAASATKECSAMARKFWSKTPKPEEITACVTAATTGTADEPVARRKWAYACAAVLTSAGFLTY